MKMIKTLLSSVALAVGFASAAHAELRIEVSGMNIAYNNSVDNALFDSGANGGTGGSAGGMGNPGQADAAIVIFYDGSTPLSFENGWVDFFLPVDQILVGTEITSSSNAGYFDILLSSTGGYGLSIVNPVIEAGEYSGNFDLIGAIGSVGASVLPYPGINVGDPIRVSFSSQVVVLNTGPANIVVGSFEAQGTGEVSANSVPEPAAIALMGLGLLAVGYTRRRRKS